MEVTMSKIMFGLLLSVCTLCAAEELTQEDIVREVVIDTTLFLDYRQTLDIKRHENLRETNKILGSHPSDTKTTAYFLAVGIGNHYLTKALPTELRPVWQYGFIAVQIRTILYNRKANVSFSF
jgi:hypothetical protein